MRWLSKCAVAAVVAACGDNLVPPVADRSLAPPTLVDTNPDPDVVEVSLVAAEGIQELRLGARADVWGYRDGSVADADVTVPGPTLDVKQGDHVIVHFTNQLPEPTTIHWHGIRVPNAFDGSEHTQTPVPPGGTFDYSFTALDEGTYWFHPHIRGDVQVEKGLYAALVVHGGVQPDVNAERVFILDDVKLAADGNLDNTQSMDDMMFGRQGNALLVNGRESATLRVQAGARERWRFVDAANSRFFKLSLPGHPFLVIGWDGGLLPDPYPTDTLLISPGERYDVIVDLTGTNGDVLDLQTLYYNRAPELPDPGPLDLMTITLGEPAAPVAALPTSWGTLDTIPIDANTPMTTLLFHEDGTPLKRIFSINGQVYPDVTPITVMKDAIAVWLVNDDVGMDHPFHLHGMFFQVLDVDGVPPEHHGWKDTVIVPRYKKLRFAVRYGEPGHWMFHCHILEHQEGGMMGVLDVTP
jgi:FtsP/CotA-like multicopper oxidase with cupredoxin domain